MATLQGRFHYPYVPELGNGQIIEIIVQGNIAKLREITVAFTIP